MFTKLVPPLQRLSTLQLWMRMVAASTVLSECIVVIMERLLLGRVTADYLLTGLVASLLVASLIVALILQSRDQTQRLADELARNEARYRALIEASAQIVWTCNPAGEAVEDSPSWRAYTGQALEQWLGFGYIECIHPDDRETTLMQWNAALAAGRPVINVYRLRHHSGEWRWSQARGVPLTDAGGAITGWVGMNTDIHEAEMAKHSLKAAKDAAEAANVAKSRFLATMSHEIRTPMNGILGMAQMLMMPEITEAERREYPQIILSSGQILLTLLNDILDLSKVEAGKLELAPTVFAPRQVIADAAALFAETARAKGLTLCVMWHGPADRRYRADALRLRQMLCNLINNAVKFTKQGMVRIEATEVECRERRALLEFAVIDNGIGIAAEKLPLLFRPFSQADSSTTREYGGTGLGLSIVHHLAKLMDGQVGVESEPGKGSRFWFRIQVELESAAATAHESALS